MMETFITSRGTTIILHRPELSEEERSARMQSIMEATESLMREVIKNEKKSKRYHH